MRIKHFALLVILFSFNYAFAQKRVAVFKDSKIKLINSTIDQDPNNLPILYFTILNGGKKDIIFTKIILNINYYKKNPRSSSSNNELESKVLTPIAVWNLNLPMEENSYIYTINNPLQISPKDPVTIKIRLFCDLSGKCIVPTQLGSFKFTFTFLTFDNKGVSSEEIVLDK
jgi:hypothetical protein